MSNIGFRIYTQINRPAIDIIKGFRGIPVANISDLMNRSGVLDSRIQKIGGRKLIGPAFTVRTRAGDNLMLHKALQMAEPGDVIVVDGAGELSQAITGEIMMATAAQKGIAGVIIDGAVRDVEALRQMEMPIYAAGVTPAGPYKDGPGEINVPVSVGGVVIRPGDIIVGDGDGVVVIRPDDVGDLIEKAQAKHKGERDIMKNIREGKRDYSWIDKELANKNCEMIDGTSE